MSKIVHWKTAALALWLAGALLGSAWQTHRFVEREHARFAAEFDAAYASVVQRLDQIEALLDGLVALLRSGRGKEFPELRDYADELLQRYPQLYTIGYQPRVDGMQRDAFEQRMSQHLGRPFRIRDFGFDGDRRWRDSPPRAYYFPVVFMAPELPDAQDVIGYDVTADARFRAATLRSAQLGRPVATLPFDLVEGGRGYIYVRALRLRPERTPEGEPDHLVSPLIRADRLFIGARVPAGGRLALHHRDAAEPAAALIWQVGEADSADRTEPWSLALPARRLHRSMPSAYQPFDLDLTARPRWRDFAWDVWAAWLVAWTLLVVGGGTAALARRRARLAEQELAAAEHRAEASRARSLDELGSGIAHELNQPLTAVVGYSQAALRMLARSSSPSPAQMDELRDTLRANADQALRAGGLIRRLRSLVRQQPVRMRPVVMQQVIASAVRLESPRIDAASVELDLRLPAADVALLGDAMLLEQLLGNLLRNAVEALATLQGGPRRIAIELGADDQRCRLVVSDTGPGLSAEQRGRAFHPFQSTKPGGIGIGLVVCSAIVQAHGGTIDVDISDGGGARFVVALPLQPPAAATSNAVQPIAAT